MRKTTSVFATCLLSASILAASSAFADGDGSAKYKITIINLTRGQPIAPVMVATHRPGVTFFEAGGVPSDELAMLAEAGNGNPMAAKLQAMSTVSEAKVTTMGVTTPGKTTTLTISARRVTDHVSVGAMLGATNDAFFAISDAELPKSRATVIYMANAYDAGTETNDELRSTVAGLGGETYSPNDSGEGYVTIHAGVHGIGDLDAATMDWRNPVAEIIIERVK